MLSRKLICPGSGGGGGGCTCDKELEEYPLTFCRFCWSIRRPAAPFRGDSPRATFRGEMSSKSSAGNGRLGELVAAISTNFNAGEFADGAETSMEG